LQELKSTKVLTVTFKAGKVSPKDVAEVEQYGVKAEDVADRLNRRTKFFEGKEMSARIYIYPGGKYVVEILPPTTTELLLYKAGAQQPSGNPAAQKVGNLSIEDVIHVAIVKKDELLAKTLKKAVKTLLGSARSVGLTVEGKDPKEVIRELEQGAYDDVLAKYEEYWRL